MAGFGIGQPVTRLEDARFLTGQGRYVGDIDLARQAHAVVLYSPHPHALIRSIDIESAGAAPGVLAVLTGADAEAAGLGGFPPLFMPAVRGELIGFRTLRPILVSDRVRCMGDRVALVVAETLAQARDALDLIVVDYEPLPALVDIEAAATPGADAIWPDCPGNVAFTLRHGDAAATAAAFGRADHVVNLRLRNNRLIAAAIEPRCALGVYDAGAQSWTLYTASQNPHGVRTMICDSVLRVAQSRLRVIAPDVGGGFGLKTNPYPEDALVLWAAQVCGRPVKWVGSRSESFLSDNHARDQVIEGALALDATGRILALRAQALHALGAYTFSAGVAPIETALKLIPGFYDIGTLDVSTRAVFTHTSPLSSYRGAGRPEATYLMERLLDEAAVQLGIDRLEIRARNAIAPARMPYATATGMVYDSGDFAALMRACAEAADWQGFAARRAASERAGRLRGRSIVGYIEQGGRFNDRMELRFDPSGSVSVVAGTHSHGQGHATTYAQMVHEWLGIALEQIRFVQGDTDQVPFGRGSFAARASLVGGCALRLAADAIIERARPIAAGLLEAAAADLAFADGAFQVLGTDRTVSLPAVARAAFRPFGLPAGDAVGLEASGSWAAEPPNYPNGAHVCELEVDPETGVVSIDRYTVVDDIGTVINPMICLGQVHGGLAQGIGQALLESVVHDPESGQLLTGSFADYAMPRADDFPAFDVGFRSTSCSTNPIGIKGVGEAGAVASPPAIINALIDALRNEGINEIEMPATPARIWQAIARQRGDRA